MRSRGKKMTIFLTILHIIVCFILILVILLQAGRGQGLASSSFGSGNVQTLFGTRAADFLTKATTVAAICFLLTSIGLDFLEARKSRSLLEGQMVAPADYEKIKEALAKVKAESDAAKTMGLPESAQQAVQGAGENAAGNLAEIAQENLPAQPADNVAEPTGN